MQRSLLIFATVVLLVLTVFLTKACAEEAAGPLGPELVSGPERWLDFQRTAPTPMAIRFDGRRILVETGCETVLYDLDSGMRLHSWTERFSTVRFSGNGRFLLTVQDDHVRVWDAESFHEVRRFAGRPPAWNERDYQADDTIATISGDGGRVAVANRRSSFHRELPRAVLVYDTPSGDLRHTVATPEKAEVGRSNSCATAAGSSSAIPTAGWSDPARFTHFGMWRKECGSASFRSGNFASQARTGDGSPPVLSRASHSTSSQNCRPAPAK